MARYFRDFFNSGHLWHTNLHPRPLTNHLDRGDLCWSKKNWRVSIMDEVIYQLCRTILFYIFLFCQIISCPWVSGLKVDVYWDCVSLICKICFPVISLLLTKASHYINCQRRGVAITVGHWRSLPFLCFSNNFYATTVPRLFTDHWRNTDTWTYQQRYTTGWQTVLEAGTNRLPT